MFEGFSPQTLDFFMQIRFNNNKAFFEANRAVFDQAVMTPLKALNEALAPTVLDIDPQFDTRNTHAISRIRRDTRFSKDKSPYRDHMWLGYRYVGQPNAEAMGFFFSISPNGYEYGFGYYATTPAQMNHIRGRILSQPETFRSIIHAPAFERLYTFGGNPYKRDHFPDAPEDFKPILNCRDIYISHSAPITEFVFTPALADKVIEGFRAAKSLYDFWKPV